ncbi:hypothetical protein [Glycomyces dulcitolivorans]|jgi:hypothetical protein|uniref:hypothetical protein n=1 Tax=Glycomyces dulcitolivorans TaxID=2200759 RepID=UPI0018E52858|nr:hypothetical protein [Glycomyces dulcitolivorans]
MSNTPQQPADGWQSPQQPPVYRPNEQPPEEPPPWSPESQRMSGMSQQQQGPVEADGTVKYVGGPGQQSPPPFGPPPGVPISPFDQPQMSPQQMPPQMPAADPFGGGGGVPVSGMPVSGMPPVSSIPASGMPVSSPVQYGQQPPYGQSQPPYGQPPFGGGQFGPQGGQLVPVSGGGGAQPWGAPDTIKRKKKGGKGPMWLLLVGVVVIAVALGVGGFILFNPGDDPGGDTTGTIEGTSQEAEPSAEESASGEASPSGEATSEAPSEEPEAPAATTVLANEGSGLSVLVPEGSTEATTPPGGFADVTGSVLGGTGPTVYFGTLDNGAIGAGEDVNLEALGTNLQNLAAEWAGGAAEGASGGQYRVDARAAYFNTFTVAGNTVMTAVVQNGSAYVGFVGTATPEQVEALEAARTSISFGP